MNKIIHLDGTELKKELKELKELVRGSVEETLNKLLDEEADRIAGASRYERSPDRVDTRAGLHPKALNPIRRSRIKSAKTEETALRDSHNRAV